MAEAAGEILDQLEWRLGRLEFYLHQAQLAKDTSHVPAAGRSDSVNARLTKLERNFADIRESSPAVAQLVGLYDRHPELLQVGTEEDRKSKLSISDVLPVVLSFGDTLQEAVSQLHQLRECQVPEPGALKPLLTLQSRLDQAQALQSAQVHELAALRERTARVLANWYSRSVLGEGEQWSEWERRMTKVEQLVRRKEVYRGRDEYGA